jgi:multidrug efflux system membrane fusion protein
MRRIRIVIGVVLVAVVVAVAWRMILNRSSANPPPPPPQAIPVEAAPVTKQDVPIYLTGLGTVQAFNTVTVTARVDGQLQNIAFTEGQEVKKGDVLAQIDPRPYKAQLDMAAAKKAQDQAQLANAEHDLERYTTLSAGNYTSKQQLDTARALVAQLSAQIQGDQAAIDNAKTQLDYTTIASPIDGRTGIRQIDEGNIVRAASNSGIVVITQLHPISVIFTLPEDRLPEVSEAMAHGPVPVDATSRDGKTVLDRGTIALIDNQIDQSTGTIRLRANFPNPNDTMWPGEFVNARLLAKVEQGALTIPSAAVQRGADGFFTYVIKADATVEVRQLGIGEDNGTIAVVQSGIGEGDRVVTAGQYRLQPGSHVQAKGAEQTAAGGDRAKAKDSP